MDEYNNQNNGFNSNPNGQPDYNAQYNNYNQQNQAPADYSMPYQSAAPNYYGEQMPEKNDGKAIASLVLGIVGIFCCGLLASIPGLVLGIVSRKNRPVNNGLATAGIIVSAIAIGFWLVSVIFLAVTGGIAEYYYSLLGY